MKKLLMTLALVVASQLAFSQTFDEVANQLKTLPNAEYQALNKDMIALYAGSLGEAKSKKVLDKVTAIKMLGIAKADAATRKTFNEKVASFKTRYEKIEEETEDGHSIVIYADKNDKGKMNSVIMAMDDGKDCQLMCVEGNLELSDIEALSSLQ